MVKGYDNNPGQRGIALVVVLWALVLLTLIAATVLSESRSTSRLARNLTDAAEAEALADGGIHRAMAGLDVPVTAGGWRADGTVYSWHLPEGEVRFRIEDEGGKIDLNRASRSLIRTLFLAVGLDTARAEALSDAIIDYRDADHLRQPQGAEDEDYEAAGLPYGAKDAPFEAVEELNQVFGMTPALYAAVSGMVTVYSGARSPDVKAAPGPLHSALQAGDDPAIFPPGNGGISVPEPIDPTITVLSLGPSAYRSRYRTYTIHAETLTKTGARFARLAVVRMVSRRGQPYQILAWAREETQLFADQSPKRPQLGIPAGR